MILIYFGNECHAFDNINKVIKFVIELDNDNIKHEIYFENIHYYKCVDCLYLFTSKKTLDNNIVCSECKGKLNEVF